MNARSNDPVRSTIRRSRPGQRLRLWRGRRAVLHVRISKDRNFATACLQLGTQAELVAMLNVFYLIAWSFIVMLPLLLLLKGSAAAAAGGSRAASAAAH